MNNDLVIQIFGLCLLIGGIGAGYWRWIRPREKTLDLQAKGLLVLVIMTLVGGFFGSTGWWMDIKESFSWDLPPLASRMLAAAGWAFAAGCWLALERPTTRRIRLILWMLAVYLAPLLVAILLFHTDRFDFEAPITYAFFAIVLAMTIPTLWYLWQQPTLMADEALDRQPASQLVKIWLGAIAVVMTVWGIALFLTDDGGSAHIWAWKGDLLSSRLIAVMLLTIAVGAATSLLYADVSRVILLVIIVYGVGVALASFWNTLADKPIKYSYLAAFSILFLGSLFVLALDRRKA